MFKQGWIYALVLVLLSVGFKVWADAGPAIKTVYDFQTKNIDEKPVKLSDYKGKVLLIVNVASKCGNTPQYEGLEKMYKKYKDKGFVILGFPCNQFHEQEPGTAADIKSFCKLNYGVTFPLFHKIEVNGPGKDPLYGFLENSLDQKDNGDIGWNFAKFLIDRDGHPIKRYAPGFKPDQFDADVQAAVAQK